MTTTSNSCSLGGNGKQMGYLEINNKKDKW